MPRRKNQLFSMGEANRLIDAVFHPLAKQDMRYWAVDLFFHAVVERDPRVSVQKFMHYDLPKIAKQYLKQQARKKRYRYAR